MQTANDPLLFIAQFLIAAFHVDSLLYTQSLTICVKIIMTEIDFVSVRIY